MPTPASSLHLHGRELELRRLLELLERVGVGGGAVVVRGEAGIGKSALLAATGRAAAERDVRVLSATGVESEAQLAFAGLHQLLHPVLHHAGGLPGPQRQALLGAFGMSEPPSSAPNPDLFLVALASLSLLAEAAMQRPLLLLVEDAHWLDRSSTEVLAFVARRLESEPVALIVAARDGYPTSFDEAGVAELRLEALDRDAATALLAARSPDLPPALRERLLVEAAGNPLALVELPVGLDRLGDVSPPAWLPLTTRLEHAFARRATGLPARTRTLLLVAALNDGDGVAETLAAAGVVAGTDLTVADLTAAVEVRLLEVREERLRFGHPLMRSAIRQGSSTAQRQEAHDALAGVLAGDADRSVWHRAAACAGPDEAVAAGLAEAATRAHRRGAIAGAVAALQRAARLSADAGLRTERLLRAAELAAELGRRSTVLALLRDAEQGQLSVRQQARISWVRDVFDDGIRGVPAGAAALAESAEQLAQGDADLALNLLWGAALRCFWAEPGPEVRRRVVTAAERVDVDQRDPRLLAILAFAAPVAQGAAIMARLPGIAVPGGDARATRLLGNAAMAVGAFDVAITLHTSAVTELREQGRLGLLARALLAKASSALHLGDLMVAIPAAAEGARLAAETSQPNLLALARGYEAVIAALRGDRDGVTRLGADAERAGAPVGARPVLAVVQLARGLSALGDGRHGDAYDQLHRMFDPADPAFHLAYRCYAICYLVEAAVHGGRAQDVLGTVAELEELALITPSPSLHAGLRYARAMLADDGDAERLFGLVLHADLARWPFARARAQLAYGAWLRRQRRPAESRRHLRGARETFDALGTVPWGERARRELRASGETSHRRPTGAHEQLTPQELQIAALAARGLTNREIGEQLYLSHRTVSTHLYRIFPKLGVTSRAALADAIRPPH